MDYIRYRKMLFTKYTLIKPNAILISVCILWMNTAISSDTAYLDALEAEAESSENIESANQNKKEEKLDTTAKNKQKVEFEARLSNELPATFRTYKMLSDNDKETVIATYFDNNRNMPKSTRALFNLYFKVK